MANFLRIFSDGASRGNPGPAASSFVVYDSKGRMIFEDSSYIGRSTNNIAEYNALLMAHKWLLKNIKNYEPEKIYFFLDSELVVKQLNGVYKIKNKGLIPYVLEIRKIEKRLKPKISYIHIERSKNKKADKLVNLVLDENA